MKQRPADADPPYLCGMPGEIVIRKATPDDLPVLLNFEQGVIAAERPFDPTLKEDPVLYYDLAGMLADPLVEIAVAEQDQKIIASGYARIEQAKPYLKHARYAYLGFMYVHPDYRGRGLNKRIMEALKAWARSKNISEMRLEVYFKNESAIKAYEKTGFIKHMIEMRMDL
jgi:GNAT superfamily N-acetyltransferase